MPPHDGRREVREATVYFGPFRSFSSCLASRSPSHPYPCTISRTHAPMDRHRGDVRSHTATMRTNENAVPHKTKPFDCGSIDERERATRYKRLTNTYAAGHRLLLCTNTRTRAVILVCGPKSTGIAQQTELGNMLKLRSISPKYSGVCMFEIAYPHLTPIDSFRGGARRSSLCLHRAIFVSLRRLRLCVRALVRCDRRFPPLSHTLILALSPADRQIVEACSGVCIVHVVQQPENG